MLLLDHVVGPGKSRERWTPSSVFTPAGGRVEVNVGKSCDSFAVVPGFELGVFQGPTRADNFQLGMHASTFFPRSCKDYGPGWPV
jgi:hypothetical protein